MARECFRNELLLNLHGFTNDFMHLGSWYFLLNFFIESTGKVGMKTLITCNEFIRGGQTRHDAALLQPINGTEGSAEEDAFHHRKGDQTSGKVLCSGFNPLLSPLCLQSDTGNRLSRME